MLEGRDKIDDFFSEELGNWEEDAPIDAWSNISNELNEQKRRKIFIIWFSAAASVLILMSFGAGFLFSNYVRTVQYAENENVNQKTSTTENNNQKSIENTPVNTNTNSIELSNEQYQEQSQQINSTTKNSVRQVVRPNNKQNTKETNKNPEEESKTVESNEFRSVELDETPTTTDNLYAESATIKLETTDIDVKVESTEKNNAAIDSVMDSEQQKVMSDTAIIYPELLLQQDNLYAHAEEPQFSKLEIGGQVAPSYSPFNHLNSPYNELAGDKSSLADAQGYGETYTSGYIQEENTKLTLSTGFGVRFMLKKRTGLQTGIYYTQVTDSYEHVEVPLFFTYKVLDTRLDLDVIAGLSSGYMVSYVNKYYSPLNFSEVTGLGISFALTKKLSLGVQPSVRLNIPVSNSYFNSRSPVSFVMFSGLTYSIF